MNIERLADLIESSNDLQLLLSNPSGMLSAITNADIIQTNGELQTLWGYGKTYGPLASRGLSLLLTAIGSQDIGVNDAALAFKTRGLDLSDPILQAQIDSMIASIPDGPDKFDSQLLLQNLKLMGVWSISLSQQRFGENPTSDDVMAAVEIVNRRNLQRQMANRWNAVSSAILDGAVTTAADAIALFGEA